MSAKSYRANLSLLEDRVQPGSMISTGLDLSLMPGSIVGQNLVSFTMPPDNSVADRVATQGVSGDQPETKNDSNLTFNPAPAQPLELASTDNLMKLRTSDDLTILPGATLSHQSHASLGDDGVHAMIPPDALFYGGDDDYRSELSNEHNTIVSDASVWDNFYVTDDTGDGQGWRITTLFNHSINIGGETADFCNWTIRTGISAGNGGNIAVTAGGRLAAGTAPSTMTLGNILHFPEYEIVVDLSSSIIQLLPGKYYLNVQPIGHGVGRWFEATATSGDWSSIGKQDPGDSWFNSSYFGYNWADTQDQNLLGRGTWNFSNGVCGQSL
jgi:hypothetical protein